MNHTCPWDATTVHKFDEVSIDEWDYDGNSTTELLDTIYDKTHLIPEFKTLYQLAAATMMSQDDSFGLAVLFSGKTFLQTAKTSGDSLLDVIG